MRPKASTRFALAVVLTVALMVPVPAAHAVWTVDSGKITANLNAVAVEGTLVFAAGEAGTILRSADGGATWSRVNSVPGHTITGIDFADPQNGWAVSLAGAVFHTTNGGQTWSLISNDLAGPFYVAEQIHGLSVLSTSAIAAVGGAQETQPAIWTSSTGAGAWSFPFLAGWRQPPTHLPPFPLEGLGFFHGIDAVSPTRAWAVGHDFLSTPNRAIVWRMDGGNWTGQSFPGETGAFFDVSFADADRGVAVGASGRIRSTNNGGTTWTARASGTSVALNGVSIARGTSSGWVVGNAGTILRTTNSGVTTWVAQASGSGAHLRDVVAIDAQRAVAVGDGGLILRTTNGGLTWSAPAPPSAPLGVRVDGADRFATALAAARLMYPASRPMPPGPDGQRTVIIASGANWPDALSASGLAGAHRAPVLLTRPKALPAEVADYIRAIQANRAIIVGGIGVVSDSVKAEVASIVGAQNVRRIGGLDRYATANLIAGSAVSAAGRQAWDGTAFVATGGDFPDALAAAPLAAHLGRPIYLAHPQVIGRTVLDAMEAQGVRRVFLLGGIGAVSPATEASLRGRGITIEGRWGGVDRFATGRVIAERSLQRGLSVQDVALATGRDFPDAIAGGVVQGLTGSVLLLTESGMLHDQARTVLLGNAGRIRSIRFVGGTSVLSEQVRASAISAGTAQP